MARPMYDFDRILEGAGHSKDLLVSGLSRFGKDHVPSNMRLFASTLAGDRTPVDENYFPQEDLNAMRVAAMSAYGRKSEKEAQLQQEAAAWKGRPPSEIAQQKHVRNTDPNGPAFIPVQGTQVTSGDRAREHEAAYQEAKKAPADVDYGDYSNDVAEMLNQEGWIKGVGKSFTDPAWRGATAIGRARLSEDASGNTIVNDSYDWNYGKQVRDLPVLEQLHTLMGSVSNPTQLGNMLGNYLAPDTATNKRAVRVNLGKLNKGKP